MSRFCQLARTRETSQGGKGKETARPADAGVPFEIRLGGARADGESPPESPFYIERELPPEGVERYRQARKEGVRAFVLWADPHRRQARARLVTAAAGRGKPAVYEVHDPAGALLARIVRERALSGPRGRTRWTVRQTGHPEAVGRKGRLLWWWVWWLLFPIQLAVNVVGLLAASGDGARTPRRIRFHADGERVLDYGGAGYDHRLEVLQPWWDWRVAAALTAVLSSHDGLLGDSWDASRA